MHVGFDARFIHLSGVGTYSRNILEQHAKKGLELTVFCNDRFKDLVPSSPSFNLVSANLNPASSKENRAFGDLVDGSGADLLHVPSHLAPTGLKTPLIVTIHDVIPLIYPHSLRGPLERARYRRQLSAVLERAEKIITVSQISLSTLSVYAGVDLAKVHVIHNGVSEQFRPVEDREAQSAARRTYDLPDEYAFWVGDFRPNKNLEFAVEAWSRVVEKLGRPLALVLAGTQEGHFARVRRMVKKRGLDGTVRFPGFIRSQDLPTVYSAALMFVFPSLYEGFGLPPLEAMACGTPCVVSNSSALPEVTGRAALMFNPMSSDQFVECVTRVATDVELREKLTEEGARQSGQFRWQKSAEETAEVYSQAISAF